MFLFLATLLFSACTEEKTYVVKPEGEFAIVYNKTANISADQWRWNVDAARYEASVSYPELSTQEFEEGIVVGNVYISDSQNDKLFPMPYVRTWIDNANNIFTETISCSLSNDKKSVDFYIDSSDKFQDPGARVDYSFKVAIIINFTY